MPESRRQRAKQTLPQPRRHFPLGHGPSPATGDFTVVGIGPVVADLRVRQHHNLAGVRWIRENFLIAGDGGIEHHFTG